MITRDEAINLTVHNAEALLEHDIDESIRDAAQEGAYCVDIHVEADKFEDIFPKVRQKYVDVGFNVSEYPDFYIKTSDPYDPPHDVKYMSFLVDWRYDGC